MMKRDLITTIESLESVLDNAGIEYEYLSYGVEDILCIYVHIENETYIKFLLKIEDNEKSSLTHVGVAYSVDLANSFAGYGLSLKADSLEIIYGSPFGFYIFNNDKNIGMIEMTTDWFGK